MREREIVNSDHNVCHSARLQCRTGSARTSLGPTLLIVATTFATQPVCNTARAAHPLCSDQVSCISKIWYFSKIKLWNAKHCRLKLQSMSTWTLWRRWGYSRTVRRACWWTWCSSWSCRWCPTQTLKWSMCLVYRMCTVFIALPHKGCLRNNVELEICFLLGIDRLD